jgi:succinate-semialdehyde dehydrogenase/glutarate-semialdehyde dehydrogenase
MLSQIQDLKLLRNQAFIGGHWEDADSGEVLDVNNPATGEVIASVAKCGQSETRRAIVVAEQAQKKWAKTPGK